MDAKDKHPEAAIPNKDNPRLALAILEKIKETKLKFSQEV